MESGLIARLAVSSAPHSFYSHGKILTTCSGWSWVFRDGRLYALYSQPMSFPLDPRRIRQSSRERVLEKSRKVYLFIRDVI
jgi:hypothetical protein